MAKYPLVHCDKESELACPICLEKGSLVYEVIEGTQACPRHGGNKQLEAKLRAGANQYRLEIWQSRVNEFTEGENAKSLRAEIGILKMVLEQVILQCTDGGALLLYSPKIADLVSKVEKTVMSCDRLERNMGMMMDKSTAMKLAGDIVDLIGMHVTDAETVDAISSGIIDLLSEIQ